MLFMSPLGDIRVAKRVPQGMPTGTILHHFGDAGGNVKTTVWCGFVGCVTISVGRSLYSLRPPSRGCMAALFLLLHYCSGQIGSRFFTLLLLTHFCAFQTLNPPLFGFYVCFAYMLLGREWVGYLFLRNLNSQWLVNTMAA